MANLYEEADFIVGFCPMGYEQKAVGSLADAIERAVPDDMIVVSFDHTENV